MENRYCVIMGGGVGSRFWPFSRNNRPKQFLDFFGIGRSLLQMSFDRFAKIIPKDHIFIVTNKIYVDLIKEQLPDLSDELCDVFWVLLCLANQTGVDLTAAFEKNIEKKTNRDKTRHINNPKLTKHGE